MRVPFVSFASDIFVAILSRISVLQQREHLAFMELKIEPREMFYRISRSCGSSLMRIRLTIARA